MTSITELKAHFSVCVWAVDSTGATEHLTCRIVKTQPLGRPLHQLPTVTSLFRNVYIWNLHASSNRPISSSKTSVPVIDPHFASCLNPRETFSVTYFVLCTHMKTETSYSKGKKDAKQAQLFLST